jgi:hypothetical protein
MASMRTTNPTNGEVEISISPGCREEISSLIKYLKDEGSIHVKAEKSHP